MMRSIKKGLLLGLSQYILTMAYIGIYILIGPSPHWVEALYLPVNFIILLAIVILTTYIGAKKFDLEPRDIWFQMLVLFIAFFVYQIGWMYFFVFSVRWGFIWKDPDIISFVGALLTAAEYSLISFIVLKR